MPLDIFRDSQREATAFARTRPGFGPGLDPTIGEAFALAFDAAGTTFRGLRVGANRYDTVQQWIDRYSTLSGHEPQNPEVASGEGERRLLYQQLAKGYDTLKATKPEIDLPPPPDAATAENTAIEMERQIAERAAKVSGRPQTFLSSVGSAAGNLSAYFVDPINLASMAVGIPEGAGILQTALRAGAIGAASQAAISTAGVGLSRQINPDYGVGDIVREATYAAFGGSVVSSTVSRLSTDWRVG